MLTRNQIATIQAVAMLTLLGMLLPACPDEEGFVAREADFKEYWPMEVGNFWMFHRRGEDLTEYTYEVTEDMSNENTQAWRVEYSFYDYGQDHRPILQFDIFYILRDDFLWYTRQESTLEVALLVPDFAFTSGDQISPVAPRTIPYGSTPVAFNDPTSDEVEKSTSTGQVGDYAGARYCSNANVDFGPTVSDTVPAQTRVAAIHWAQACQGGTEYVANSIYGKNVGPLHLHGSLKLVYAIVNGNEYTVIGD